MLHTTHIADKIKQFAQCWYNVMMVTIMIITISCYH